ncbi:MAG: hypothetical protein GWM87_02835 [Xanthomonadales bacterium]|nr:hypothetical protein [Xanthomonadales bacterium]NIX11986.1 hypothetical protein [Xanthomonadales bacterium]
MHITVGVTGHRDLVTEELPALRELVRGFFADLDAEFPGLDLQLVSPLAEGADQLVAEVAVDMGIPLIVPMPMQQSEYEKDFGSRAGLENFRRLLNGAQIIPLPLVKGSTHEDLLSRAEARDWQYAQLGVFVSNHCQVLLALWNGKPDTQIGGTAGVVNYHLTAVMPGFSVAEESPNLLADNENDLAYHIVVSRDRPDGDPARELKTFDAHWMSAHFERWPPGEMPPEYHDMLLRLQEFQADYRKYEEEVTREAQGLLGEALPLERPGGSGLVHELFKKADWLAIHFQKRVNQSMLITHSLAVVMGLVFILYAEYGDPQWLLYLFLALFATGVVFHYIGHRREWHRKYLDYRALAEGLRVQLYWNLAGVVETQSAVFAYDNFLQKQDVDLGWIRHVMRSASLWRDRTTRPDDGWVRWVCDQWVGDPEAGTGQLAYYRRKSVLKAENYRRTTRLGSLSLWTGILIAVVLAVFAGRIDMDSRHVLLIFMGVLPLIAGVRDAYSHKKAERELIKQYRFMSRVLANARRLLLGSRDVAFRRRVLKAVGNAALEEHAEWILMHRERPLEHGGL